MNIEKTENWDKYELLVQTNKGTIKLVWSDVETLAKLATLQSGLFAGSGSELSKQLFFENFPKWAQQHWDRCYNMGLFNLPNDPVVIDIGSGIAVIDLLLQKYLNSGTFYLVDKNQFEFKNGIYYSSNYPFYNNWDPVHDAIKSSQMPNEKFLIQDPEDPWPESDCISSYYSWCFHYPKDTYWQKVKQSLKVGGKLIVDVRLVKDNNVIEEISEEFKCEPIKFTYPNMLPKHIDNFETVDPNVLGYRCLWTRNY